MKISILTLSALLSVCFLPVASVSGFSSNESIFISEISFAGSISDNNCQVGPKIVANLCNFDKWIELYNPGDTAVSLDNWQIEIQGGLVEKLSGSIGGQSFLVLGNTNYRYQHREKVEENFSPQINSQSSNSSASSVISSSIFSSSFTSSLTKNNSANYSSSQFTNESASSAFSLAKSSQPNSASQLSPNSFSAKSSDSNFLENSKVANLSQASQISDLSSSSSQNSNQLDSDLNSSLSSSKLENNTENSTESQKFNLTTIKPKLTLEPKSGQIQSKTLNFNQLSSNNKISNSDNVYLQINRESLSPSQINFLNSQFKGLFQLQNGHYETLNSQITTSDKQQFTEQKITWKLQRQTTVNLQSVLTQAGIASSPLGILHGLSPSSPQVKLKHNGNVVSQRQFANSANQSVNRYTMEFEDFSSQGFTAQESYFPKNFGTPGFGKIKKKDKNEPVIAVNIQSNNLITPNANATALNPQTDPQLQTNPQVTQVETAKQTNPESNAIQTDLVSQAVPDPINSTVENHTTETKIVENKPLVENLAPNFNPVPELSPVIIPESIAVKNHLTQTQGQIVVQPSPLPKNQLAQNLTPKPSQSLNESKQALVEVSDKNKVNLVEEKSLSTLENNLAKNYLWQLYLPANFQPNSVLSSPLPMSLSNSLTLSNLDPSFDSEKNNLPNSNLPTSSVFQSTSDIQTSLNYETTFGLSTNAFLNLWVNLLLLILAFRKKKNSPAKPNLMAPSVAWKEHFSYLNYSRLPVPIKI